MVAKSEVSIGQEPEPIGAKHSARLRIVLHLDERVGHSWRSGPLDGGVPTPALMVINSSAIPFHAIPRARSKGGRMGRESMPSTKLNQRSSA
jgi:hypothetical protein